MRYFNNIATPIKWPVKVPLGRIAWQNTQEQSNIGINCWDIKFMSLTMELGGNY